MAVDLQLKTRTSVSAVNTAFNGVVNNAGQLSDVAIDNTTTPWPTARFTYTGTFASAPSAGALIEVWAARSNDGGTTFETTSNGTSGAPPGTFIGVIPIDPVTTAQTKISASLAIPPGHFKPWYRNYTGLTAPTSTGGITMIAETETGV